jgi:hypothetical protein
MTRDSRRIDRELETLLERGRIIPRLSDVVRARALTRARAHARATVAEAPEPVSAPMPTPPRGRRLWMALAASLALAVGAVGAGAALRGRVFQQLEPAPPSDAPPIRTLRIAPRAPRPAAPAPAPIAKPRRGRTTAAQESYAAELDLLQQAQVAYAGRDFQSALVLVAEHARKFPSGRLAEEREALRVRSLARSGRRDEARRAGAAFAARFPRSVFLPRLAAAVDSPE